MYEKKSGKTLKLDKYMNRIAMILSGESIKNLTDAASEPIETQISHGNRKVINPWFCQEIKEISKEKRKAYLNYRILRTPEPCEIYRRIINETTTRVRQIKDQH